MRGDASSHTTCAHDGLVHLTSVPGPGPRQPGRYSEGTMTGPGPQDPP